VPPACQNGTEPIGIEQQPGDKGTGPYPAISSAAPARYDLLACGSLGGKRSAGTTVDVAREPSRGLLCRIRAEARRSSGDSAGQDRFAASL
jgi:hypothetical protein